MEVKGMLFFQIDSIDRPIFNNFFTKFPNDYLETEDDGIFGMEDLLQITLTLSAASLPYVLKILYELTKKYGTTSFKYKGLQIDNITEKNAKEIIYKLLEMEENNTEKESDRDDENTTEPDCR